MRVLVVDDDPDIRNLLKRFLQARGREILTAEDGEQALGVFTAEDLDLVIRDINLPKLDGWEVLAKMRETSDLPVIILTASDSPGDTARGLLTGADDYVAKPFDLGEMEARITAVMRRYVGPSRPSKVSVGVLVIDGEKKSVRVRDEEVSPTPTRRRDHARF